MFFSDLLKKNHSFEPSSPRRIEPRFIPHDPHRNQSIRKHTNPTSFSDERLLPFTSVSRPDYLHTKGTSKSLLRKEIYADPSLGSYFTASLLTHLLIIFALTYQSSQKHKIGNPQSQNNAPIEMIFSQPPATSGMVGPQSPQSGGGNQAPSQNTATIPKEDSLPQKAQPQEQVPQQTTQSSTQTPQNGEVTPTPQALSTTPPLTPKKGKNEPQKPTQNASSLLNHPQEYSLNQATAPPRPQKGKAGGSGSPIDLSVGPVVQNGKINAHYSSRTSVHGVSDDYAAELDAWIQRHLYYPPEAAERGEEGNSSVHVILERSGRVKNVWETQSSTETLDAATVGMFTNAQLPPVPPDMKDKIIQFDVTVNYILIRN